MNQPPIQTAKNVTTMDLFFPQEENTPMQKFALAYRRVIYVEEAVQEQLFTTETGVVVVVAAKNFMIEFYFSTMLVFQHLKAQILFRTLSTEIQLQLWLQEVVMPGFKNILRNLKKKGLFFQERLVEVRLTS